jgi:hypothetical protein
MIVLRRGKENQACMVAGSTRRVLFSTRAENHAGFEFKWHNDALNPPLSAVVCPKPAG